MKILIKNTFSIKMKNHKINISHKMIFFYKNEKLSLFMQITPPHPPPPFFRDFRAGGKAGGTHRRIASLTRKCLRSGRAGV